MIKNILELSSFTDKELLTYLKASWEIQKNKQISVHGVLKPIISANKENYFILVDIKSPQNALLDYPVDDLEKKEWMSRRGVYVPSINDMNADLRQSLDNGTNIYVKCELTLASPSERSKHQNPLLLGVRTTSLNLLKKINHEGLIKDEDGNLLLEESIYNTIYPDAHDKLQEELAEIRQGEVEKIENEILDKKFDLSKLEEKNNELDNNKVANEKQISEQEKILSENTKVLTSSYHQRESLQKDLETLKKSKEEERESHMKKLERFRSFVKIQADTLLSLEFIDEDEYNNILMIDKEQLEKVEEIDFHLELDGDYSLAISHIQAYLFKKDILYPKYIIEDFFALIQTNDLIILAGESGSGKTNLVKSFAKAVGGVSKIIPVKPNWTSSEDLLGYYNPLEKKYLSTPFLEALLDASKHPEIPYFICLDEMNLARVEYYFADFLSLLEEREGAAEIHLYSDDESSHVLSEFNNVLEIIKNTKDKYKKGNIVNFVELIQDDEINEELKRIFGFSNKDSLIKYHSDLRRMISGIINIPSSIEFPQNVRIIGAINIDETTHYLSPKILDRAHIMKFDSPLLFDWDQIQTEINTESDADKAIHFDIDDFGTRDKYPKFEMENEFCKLIANLTKQFFTPLGVEVGLRTIRQGLNYQSKFSILNSNYNLFINNFFIHKILPKLTFDGSKMVGDIEKKDLLLQLQSQMSTEIIKEEIIDTEGNIATVEFEELINKAKTNEWIVNYWA